MSNFFMELAIVIVIAFVVALLVNRLKQPLLVGYMLTGVLVGPVFLNILSNRGGYESFASLGIAFLLFIVGLHLNIKLVKEVGWVSLVAGLVQISFTALLGWVLLTILGFEMVPALLIAIAITFSSTIIVVKLLTDKGGINKLHGKISIGILLVQDLVVIVLLMILGATTSTEGYPLSFVLLRTTLFAIVAFIMTFVLARYLIPPLMNRLAKNTELLFVFVIAWCFGIAGLFDLGGLSLEIGALVAGIALASSPFQHEISSRIKPLRDFFIIMFFIVLGFELMPADVVSGSLPFLERMPLVWETIKPVLGVAGILSVFVLISHTIIPFFTILFLGYSSRTAFKTGVAISQISEFSLILVLAGRSANLLDSSHIALVTYVAIITIVLSSYMVMHGEGLYKRLSKVLNVLERKRVRDSLQGMQGMHHDILLFGVHRLGHSLLQTLKRSKRTYLIVDHDPERIRKLTAESVPCVYGDAGNIEFISEFNLRGVKLLISTIGTYEVNALLLENIRGVNPTATIILTADSVSDALELYRIGADYVILPHFLGGHYVSTLIENFEGDPKTFLKEKLRHLNELKQRKQVGHHYPR